MSAISQAMAWVDGAVSDIGVLTFLVFVVAVCLLPWRRVVP